MRGTQHQKQRKKSTLENELVETLDELQQALSVTQLISLGTERGTTYSKLTKFDDFDYKINKMLVLIYQQLPRKRRTVGINSQ